MSTATHVPSPDDIVVSEAPTAKNSISVVQQTPRIPQAERAADDVVAPLKYPPTLIRSILAVTKAIGAVEKLGLNKDQNYTYQRWDDILARLSEILPEHGLLIVQTQTGQSLFEGESLVSITYDFIIMNSDGECWPVPIKWSAAAKVRAKTGTVDDKAITKCHTQAEKYFFVKLFKIRSIEMPDSDAGDESGEAPQKRTGPRVPSPDDEPSQDESIAVFMAGCQTHIGTFNTEKVVNDWWASAALGMTIEALQLPQTQVDILKGWCLARKKALRAAAGAPQTAQNATVATPMAPAPENAPTVTPSPYPAADDAIGLLEADYTTAIQDLETFLWSFRGKERSELDAAWEATIGQLDDVMLLPPDRVRLQGVRNRISMR